MKIKSKIQTLLRMMAVVLCMTAFSMPAFADNSGNADGDDPPITTFHIDTEAVSTDPTTGGDAAVQFDVSSESILNSLGDYMTAFTPDGNLSLIDDFARSSRTEDGDIETKQFITVQSKNGNYFYIVIDRAGDAENVYFMNLVDEADLMALTETEKDDKTATPPVCTCKDKCYAGHVNTSCPVCATDMSNCTGKEAEPEPAPVPETPAPETPKKTSVGNPLAAILLLLALGGGAAYYFLKVKGKPKPQTRGEDDLSEYEYGVEDGEEYEFEPYKEGEAPAETSEDGT